MTSAVTYASLTKSGSEWGEQAAIFLWKALHVGKLPIIRWLHAINNQGHGDAVHGARDKAAGVTAGVHDMFLPVTCKQFAGLYIELKKRDGGKGMSDVQSEFARYCETQGYAWRECHGYKQAIQAVLEYLSLAGYVNDPAEYMPTG
jgi:hypothetical protein